VDIFHAKNGYSSKKNLVKGMYKVVVD